jgi:hypothetical protein
MRELEVVGTSWQKASEKWDYSMSTSKKADFAVKIPDSLIDKADKCEKGLACLNDSHHNICPVENCVSGKVHFIKCKSNCYCPYKVTFGYDDICRCPIRTEIYNKFGK